MARGKILLVEDEAATREALAEALTQAGHQVESAASAEAGLALLRQGRFKLVVTDFSMPDSTGTAMLEVAADLGLLEGCTALLITAFQPANPQRMEVFHKPLDLRRFLERVAQIVEPHAAPPAPAAVPAPRRRVSGSCYVDCDALKPLAARARQDLAAQLLDLHERGASLYAWSSEGADKAQQWVDTLGLTNAVSACLPKPSLSLSSQAWSGWEVAEHAPEELARVGVDALLLDG